MDSTNSKLIPEITIQRVMTINNKPRKKIKWTHQRKYNLKEVQRKKRGINNKKQTARQDM